MRLIGAGLPRTGTLTQKVALEMLGLGPCYHMVNVLGDLAEVERWARAVDGDVDWDAMFDGHEATVDWPGAFFTTELAEAFPDAKVLLSVRDGESWERSMRDTIWGVLYGDSLMRDLSSARGRIDPQWNAYMELMREMWRRSGLLDEEGSGLAEGMRRYNDGVQEAVPADRLLVWSPADGWEPLCEFLEVGVPDVPVPHLNDSGAFADRIVDGALIALQEWRAREGAEVPA